MSRKIATIPVPAKIISIRLAITDPRIDVFTHEGFKIAAAADGMIARRDHVVIVFGPMHKITDLADKIATNIRERNAMLIFG